MEQTYTKKGQLVRPFCWSAKVVCRSYSIALQRALTDFGADESFARAIEKVKEHYEIDIPVSSCRNIVQRHASNIKRYKREIQKIGKSKQSKAVCIIGETDGGMIPIVIMNQDIKDRRKGRKVAWTECRLSLAYEKGSVTPLYDATLGSVKEAGDQLASCVNALGRNKKTKIHCLGDGALWIADQVERIFGNDATYLIDFFHLSQYLAEAATCCSPENRDEWRQRMQTLMKANKINDVLKELEEHINYQHATDQNCLAKKCYQYIIKRLNQFDYKGALDQDLPIGSGRIESGHRSVIQKRLKITGAWWLEENASNMIALRVIRSNNCWQNYWSLYVKDTLPFS